jgi:muramoyltetrapeptide carboxypeptidase
VGTGAVAWSTRLQRRAGNETRTRARRLEAGGTVAVLSAAPGGSARTVAWLESEGYAVVLAEAGSGGGPTDRARSLEQAFADPDVAAIFCVEEGGSTAQLLRHLDYELIAEHPKALVGGPDVTALHAALAGVGLVTFWGPSVRALETADEATRTGLLRALTGFEPLGDIDRGGPSAVTIVSGIAEGELVGGSAAALSLLMGTPWELDTRGKILLLTGPRAEPWRIETYLLHLLNAGKLLECAGVCLPGLGEEGAAVELVDSIVEPLGIPAVRGLPLAFGPRLATVPLGVRVRLDAYDGRLEVLEAGVS